MPANVSVRLGVDGAAEVKAAHKDLGDSGQEAFGGIATAADRATAATDAAGAATDRQLAKYERLAAAARASAAAQQSQSNINTLLGVGGSGKSAADSASVFEAAARAEDQLAAKTAALKAEIDPLWLAQLKLNAAVGTANELLGAGKISTAEHAAATALAQKAFADAEKAAKAMAGGVALSAVQYQELGAVAHHSIDALAAGANPMRVLTTEGARLGVALGSGPNGVAGIFSLLSGSGALAIGGIALVAGGMFAAEAIGAAYEARLKGVERQLENAGRAGAVSATQVEAVAESQAKAGKVSVQSAEDIATSIAVLGRVGAAQLGPATATAQKLSIVLGDVKAASADVALAYTDPAKAAEVLNAKLQFLTAAQVEQIKSLADAGERAQATALLMGELGTAVGHASEDIHGLSGFVHTLHLDFDGLTNSIGKFMSGGIGNLNSADPVLRLKAIGAEIQHLKDQGTAAGNPLFATYAKEAAAAQAEIANNALRTTQSQNAAASAQLSAAFNALNPQAAQIQAKIGQIAQLKAALNDTTGKSLALLGKDRAEVQATIVEGDKEIAKLKERAQYRDKHAETLGREAAAMTVDAQAALKSAAAYLVSDQAGQEAETRRKAYTDATKKGIDVEAQYQRQLALDLATTALQGAKAAAELTDRADAQGKLNAAVATGTLTSAQAAKQGAIETQLRPLLTAQAHAHGEALRLLTEDIDKQRAALQRSNAEQATANLQSGSEAANDRIASLRIEAALADDLTGARERLLAVLKLEQSPDFEASGDERAKEVATINAIAEANQQLETRRAQYVATTRRDQTNAVDLAQLELSLVGATQDQYDAEIGRLQRIQALKAAGVDLSSADAQAILQQGSNLDAIHAKLRASSADWTELKGFGDKFVDDVLNPQNWKDWRSFGLTAMQDIEQEFIKLALLNPLKNALFGESNPTLGSVSGVLGKLFSSAGSSGGGIGPVSAPFLYDFPGFATGTDYSPAGWARINEAGGEIVNLPDGSQVIPADQTRRLVSMAANDRGGGVTVHVHQTFNAQGAGPREIDQLRAEMAAQQRNLPGTIVATVNDAKSRGQIAA